jgi:hypothetical protein
VGIVAEFDTKNKHKMRVLQVERGVSLAFNETYTRADILGQAPEEVSYRCDDLKSGKISVSLLTKPLIQLTELQVYRAGI